MAKIRSPCACGLLLLSAFIAVPVLPVTCVASPFGFSGLFSGQGRELLQPREPFSVMLRTCRLREDVGNGLTVHALGEQTHLTRHAGHGSGLLGGSDFGHPKGHKVLGAHAVAMLHHSSVELLSQTLVCNAGLGNRLCTRLGELGMHLGEHVHHLSVALTRLNGECDSVGAGNAILLGSHRATPICPTVGLSFLAPVWCGKWHKIRYPVFKVHAFAYPRGRKFCLHVRTRLGVSRSS